MAHGKAGELQGQRSGGDQATKRGANRSPAYETDAQASHRRKSLATDVAMPPGVAMERVVRSGILPTMGATETVDLFLELINDDAREKAVDLFAEHAVLGVSTPGSDERTNLRGRDRVGGWFVRAGDGFRMYANEGRSMGSTYIADVTVMRPGINPMHVEANFRVENGEIVALFLQPIPGR